MGKRFNDPTLGDKRMIMATNVAGSTMGFGQFGFSGTEHSHGDSPTPYEVYRRAVDAGLDPEEARARWVDQCNKLRVEHEREGTN